MKKCVRCNEEIIDSGNASLNNAASITKKCSNCIAKARQPFLQRFKNVCKPERPVTRKEYRTLFIITISLTSFLLVGSVLSFSLFSLVFSVFIGQNPIVVMVDNLIGIIATAAIPAILLFIAFGVTTILGIIKRSILEFTSLSQGQSNIIAVASVALLTITGIIFFVAILLGIVVSIRAIRRFRSEPAA